MNTTETIPGIPEEVSLAATTWTKALPGQQYQDYFTDQEVKDADADAQADPRY